MCITSIVLATTIALAQPEMSTAQPAVRLVPRTADLTATVTLGWVADDSTRESTWHFRAIPDRPGLLLRATQGDDRKELEILTEVGGGPVVSVVARAHYIKDAWHMIALGIGSFDAIREKIEYRLVVYHAIDSMPKNEHWIYTDPLLIRTASFPVHGVSLTFPGGDSVALGLHSLMRGDPKADSIESHFFVNHCPTGAADGKIPQAVTEYYKHTIQGGGESMDMVRIRRELKEKEPKPNSTRLNHAGRIAPVRSRHPRRKRGVKPDRSGERRHCQGPHRRRHRHGLRRRLDRRHHHHRI